MMDSPKNVSKSIRLSQELYDYISSYRGNGFNEKFKNIIEDARDTEPQRRARLESLDDEIKAKKKIVEKAQQVLRDLGGELRWY